MLPQVIIARIGWMALGSAITLISRSEIAKEAVHTFNEGIEGLMEDYKRDLAKNKATVDKAKKGKP